MKRAEARACVRAARMPSRAGRARSAARADARAGASGLMRWLSCVVLVGACALTPDPYAADPRVGRLRHLYVHPDWRRCGLGRRLVDAARAEARSRFDVLRVRAGDPSAAAFYDRLGLARTDEPDATHSERLR